MEFTGERPTLEHEIGSSRIRYAAILPHCYNLNVLDFGCGIGHGSNLLARYATDVVGYDSHAGSIVEATEHFAGDNLHFVAHWEPALLLQDRDIVASVECIEHLERDDLVQFLRECSSRVPKITCTTPNGDLFPYHPMTKEARRGFHVWHYTYEELYELFSRFYKFVEVSGHAFDPALDRYTGHTIFATNRYAL